MSLVDVLDEHGQSTGKQVSLKEVHVLGLTHRLIHVWILNSNKQLLIQKRSPNKVADPDLWDVSCVGHVDAGETSVIAARREVLEELQLSFEPKAFTYLYTQRYQRTLNNNTYFVDHIADTFLVRADAPLNTIIIDPEEVADIRWVSYETLPEMIENTQNIYVDRTTEYKTMLEYLQKQIL